MKRVILLSMLFLPALACNIFSPGATPTPSADLAATVSVLATTNAQLSTAAAPSPEPSATFAPPSSESAAASATPSATSPTTGAIAGTLTFPSEGIPALRVVAFNTGNGEFVWVQTEANQSAYAIEGLPPGVYHVVAYNNDLAGGYTPAVACGLSVECTDHSLIDVTVTAGATVTGVDPGDWYAPPGTFPPNPTP